MPRWHPPSAYFPVPDQEPSEADKRSWRIRKIHGYLLDCKSLDWIAVEMGMTVAEVEDHLPEVHQRIENLTGSIRKSYAGLGFQKLERGLETIGRALWSKLLVNRPDTGEEVEVEGWTMLKPSDLTAMLGTYNQLVISQARLCGAIGPTETETRRELAGKYALEGDLGQEVMRDPKALHSRLKELVWHAEHKGAENAKRVGRNGSNGNGAHA